MHRVFFEGGPHDGLTLGTGLVAAFLYTDGKRCYRSPSTRRSLYRSPDGTSYHFAGFAWEQCVCGVFRKKRRACGMCGSSAVAA